MEESFARVETKYLLTAAQASAVAEGLRQQGIQILPALIAGLELVGLRAQLLVRHGGVFVRKRLDLVRDGGDALELPVGIAAEQFIKKSHSLVPFVLLQSVVIAGDKISSYIIAQECE